MCACAVACVWGWATVGAVSLFHCVGRRDQTPVSRLGAKPHYPLGHLTCPTCFLRHLWFKLHQLKTPEANPKTKTWVTAAFWGSWWHWERNGKWQEKEKQPFSVSRAESAPETPCLRSMDAGYLFTQQHPVCSQEDGPVPGGTNGKLTGSATASIHLWALRCLFLRAGSWWGETVTHPCDFSGTSWGAPMISQSNKSFKKKSDKVTKSPCMEIVKYVCKYKRET